MYLGEWKTDAENCVAHGFGIVYNNAPENFKGLVYMGKFRDGNCHGIGESFWVHSCKTWTSNHLPGSAIKPNLPYTYIGKCDMDQKNDDKAIVTLKKGVQRVGQWKDNKPIGDWWNDHVVGSDMNSNDDDTSAPVSISRSERAARRSPSTKLSQHTSSKRSSASVQNNGKNKKLRSYHQDDKEEEEEEDDDDDDDEGEESKEASEEEQSEAEAENEEEDEDESNEASDGGTVSQISTCNTTKLETLKFAVRSWSTLMSVVEAGNMSVDGFLDSVNKDVSDLESM
ncbi:MAG: hypothetical protein SGILL_004932 [Bacillariaceae sp.]